ncbi:hypothetical protein SAMN05421753_104191 [Planctomicrobium piriforme]|uniref:Uncharacterized protein n=1 Tax=Planctomicrobium piriforme TaxID=1576369 RepID=A0A1I3EEW3_9PLAN|nr:hypothetical protein SAMN05421753_104191 [Planctomicrobium piriforme]
MVSQGFFYALMFAARAYDTMTLRQSIETRSVSRSDLILATGPLCDDKHSGLFPGR